MNQKSGATVVAVIFTFLIGGCTADEKLSSDSATSETSDSVSIETGLKELSFPGGNSDSATSETDAGKQIGTFESPCTNNDECDSGFCVQGLAGKMCTVVCVDSCPIKYTCQQGPTADPIFICVPECTPEVCDGKDNDCDNKVDEGLCEDGNPCTFDECNLNGPLGSCKHKELNGGDCNDGSVCTESDKCVNGKCAGGTPIPCTDSNVCTKDNQCNGVSGCFFPPQNGPCEDGNPCTLEDSCKNSACWPGKDRVCIDGNPCTLDACDPTKKPTGCFFKPVPDGPNNSCSKSADPTLIPWCTKGACGFQKN